MEVDQASLQATTESPQPSTINLSAPSAPAQPAQHLVPSSTEPDKHQEEHTTTTTTTEAMEHQEEALKALFTFAHALPVADQSVRALTAAVRRRGQELGLSDHVIRKFIASARKGAPMYKRKPDLAIIDVSTANRQIQLIGFLLAVVQRSEQRPLSKGLPEEGREQVEGHQAPTRPHVHDRDRGHPPAAAHQAARRGVQGA